MFGRKKKQEAAAQGDALTETAAPEAEESASQAPAEEQDTAAHAKPAKSERVNGPLDASEAQDEVEGMVDLGSLRLPIIEGMNLNLEVEQESQQVVSVAIELNGSRVQLQAFAAPKSEGLWEGISSQIDQSVTAQGGRTDRRDGSFGPEILARVPATGPDGSQGTMIARFVGIDGPRWFLRAVFGGPAAINEESAKELEDLLARVVVDRGQTPMAPTELLPLSMPTADPTALANAGLVADPDGNGPAEDAAADGDTKPKRGPEITQIG